jgi:hypothetical protein
MSESQRRAPTPDSVRRARANPNGWVYQIDDDFEHLEQVPPSAVLGAWEVNSRGELTGRFVVNPRHRARSSSRFSLRGLLHWLFT